VQPNFHATGAHYINADTTAFMQFLEGDLFKDFPTLRFIIPHGGGAVPVPLGPLPGPGRHAEAAAAARARHANVYFDTCVYHQPGIDLLFRVIDVENILFGSEMVGAVRGIDPETGQYFDDTKRYIDALPIPAATRPRCSRATRGASIRGWTPS
jgi:4-oxalmesaconate hydratase